MTLRRTAVLWLCSAAGLYVTSFLVAYAYREPAANLAYFVYPGGTAADHALYVSFWPLYHAHRLAFGGERHNRDRPVVVATGP